MIFMERNDRAFRITKMHGVEIVTCGKCKYFNDGDCTQVARLVGEKSFCDLAERVDGDDYEEDYW